MLETKEERKPRKKSSSRLRLSAAEILRDYELGVQSRQASIIGRREVLNGRAKFGIFGDGKELAQIAMARAFRKGDFRSGYYRDQTFMFALGATSIQQFFAQLYAHPDVTADPNSAGRQMNAHFATRLLNEDGTWRDQTQVYNSSADLSPTGSQMPRMVGLGYASRLYRELDELQHMKQFSNNGNEIVFGTIGNASTAEGLFWESLNAIGVLGAAVVLSILDDEYGISVPNEYQITKGDLTELLDGFRRQPGSVGGFELVAVKGWDYPALLETYERAAELCRTTHTPVIIHVTEMTQPSGHSTSGSHERYKSEDRLDWEKEFDCLAKMREWMIDQQIAEPRELDHIEHNAEKLVEEYRLKAWRAYTLPLNEERNRVLELLDEIGPSSLNGSAVAAIRRRLGARELVLRRDILAAVHEALVITRNEPRTNGSALSRLAEWNETQKEQNRERYSSHLYSLSKESAMRVPEVKAVYSADSAEVPGFQILNAAFDAMLRRDPRVIIFGEDVGLLGGVNQTCAGLQFKYGELRVSDTGIREATIVGQAMGMALRGLRPIAEIQYLDYLLYALQILSDDLASLHWRTKGGQKAPVIISTRGHRLEGIWHAGSPMGSVIHLLRGMHVCVPRNMTQAAGLYNTLLLGDEPGLVVEVLNGYRLKETMPENIGEFTVPLGTPEILRAGKDVSLVTYGAMCQIAMEAAGALREVDIDVEVIDVQTLLPFDTQSLILDSIKKTSRVVFVDEDVPGGATAYMLQEAIEKQGGFHWLDCEPRTITSKAHRPAYGSDGAYFSKPNREDLFDTIYDMMNETDPARYPRY